MTNKILKPTPTPQQMLVDLLSHITTGHFGTKNRAELLQRVEAIREAVAEREPSFPMGASQWKEYGKKYGYLEYFLEEIKDELNLD